MEIQMVEYVNLFEIKYQLYLNFKDILRETRTASIVVKLINAILQEAVNKPDNEFKPFHK